MPVWRTRRPPPSIASNAFVIRLRKTCVSWSRSPAIAGSERSNTRSISTRPPVSFGPSSSIARSSSSWTETCSRLASRRRAKLSRSRTILPARVASASMVETLLRAGAADGSCRSRRLLWARITVRGLLISWATLAASSPMAASFADSTRVACARWSSSIRFELLVQAGVLQGDDRLAGEHLQQLDLVAVEDLARQLFAHDQSRRDRALHEERHDERHPLALQFCHHRAHVRV